MFKPQFAPLVKSGQKRQTIRPMPKRMPRVGDLESWREWSGKPYRSKTRELATVKLTHVSKIKFEETGTVDSIEGFAITMEKSAEFKSENQFAQADGFVNFEEMWGWFRIQHGFPFHGILIRAEDAPADFPKLLEKLSGEVLADGQKNKSAKQNA